MRFETPIRFFYEGLGSIVQGGAAAAGGGGGGSVDSVGADNGTTVTGGGVNPIIQLGQTIGEGGDPGKLLHNTEIPMNGFDLSFLGSAAKLTLLSPGAYFAGGPDSEDAVDTNVWEPSNYLTAYPGHGVAGRFTAGWELFDGVNIYPRPNVVGQFWAYNLDPGGALFIPEESGFGFRTETDYGINSSNRDNFEFHLPQVVSSTGLGVRLWSFYIDKLTLISQHQSQCQDFNFNTINDNLTWMSMGSDASGFPTTTDAANTQTWSARGSGSNTNIIFNDLDNTFSVGNIMWDRGSFNMNLAGTPGATVNNYQFTIGANIRQEGAPGSGASFIQTVSVADQLTFFGAQLFADTFVNNPSFEFDRRLGAGGGFSSLIGDGNNGGEVTWSGDRNMNIIGIANGVGGGVHQCFDMYVNQIDPADDLNHDNMILSNAGPVSFPRGSISTANPLSGIGLWKLGQVQAGVVAVDLANYVEVDIGGTIVKLLKAA